MLSTPSDPDRLLDAVVSGEIAAARRMPSGIWTCDIGSAPRGLLSGSFNPLHDGHVALRRIAEAWLGTRVDYELAIVNADKPSLAPAEIHRRCLQFDDASAVITRSAAFVRKAEILPDTVFVVGADTALRILDERYYESVGGMSAALGMVRDCRCRFLVACRRIGGRLVTGADLSVPVKHRDLFQSLPVEEFRRDVSSSELRRFADP